MKVHYFQKNTPGAPMGMRIFDLTQLLKISPLSETEKLLSC